MWESIFEITTGPPAYSDTGKVLLWLQCQLFCHKKNLLVLKIIGYSQGI